MGAQAAERGVKEAGKSGQPKPSRGGATSPSRLMASGGRGTERGNAPPPPEQSDYRHAIVAAQYENMRRLGRDIPFGVSMILNGHYRDVLEEGKRPFDLFMDA
jgi:hypothetical protein